MKSVKKANSYKEFNAKVLRKNLFNDGDLSVSDALDYLLYMGQSAFARSQNQERNELHKQDWMSAYKVDYLNAAKTLGLVDQKLPQHNSYVESWIAGASRVGVLARLIDFNYLLSRDLLKTTGKTLILAGQRPLWAEIDGISPQLLKYMEDAISKNMSIEGMGNVSQFIEDKQVIAQEGKNYMKNLAEKSGIKLNASNPFIIYDKEDFNIPKGLYAGRTYPNYIDIKKGYLSETLMSQDLLMRYLSDKINVGIIDTESDKKGARPDTATTARDAAQKLVAIIRAKNILNESEQLVYHVSFHSNQPYIDRQTLTAQREVNKVLEENNLSNIRITLDGIGFSAKENDVAKIHSELGAFFLERYKSIIEANSELNSSRDLSALTYRSRPKISDCIEVPNYSEEEGFSLLRSIQNYFDNL